MPVSTAPVSNRTALFGAADTPDLTLTAKKLERHFLTIEREAQYCALAQARLERAEQDRSVQGYEDGVFWERNSKPAKK